MPYTYLSDSRIGLHQVIIVSLLIREKFDGDKIVGTRVVFDNIGALSEKQTHVVYSNDDFVKALNWDLPIVLSRIESLLVGIDLNHVYNVKLIFNSGQLSIVLK